MIVLKKSTQKELDRVQAIIKKELVNEKIIQEMIIAWNELQAKKVY